MHPFNSNIESSQKASHKQSIKIDFIKFQKTSTKISRVQERNKPNKGHVKKQNLIGKTKLTSPQSSLGSPMISYISDSSTTSLADSSKSDPQPALSSSSSESPKSSAKDRGSTTVEDGRRISMV